MRNGRAARFDLEEPSRTAPFPLVENAEDHPQTTWDDVRAGHIEGAASLDTAPPQELLRQQLELEHQGSRSIMKSGYILYRLWVTGAFQDLTKNPGDPRYPWTQDGFYKFLHDHGSHLSPTEISARQKVFETFIGFPVDVHRKVESIGVNKARAALKYVTRENVVRVLEICAETPYVDLRDRLDTEFPGFKKTRNRKTPEELKHDDHVRVMRVIASSDTGRIGGIRTKEWIFVPRQKPLTEADEFKARQVFEMAFRRVANDRDEFFMKVVDLVAREWLTSDEIRMIENTARARAAD